MTTKRVFAIVAVSWGISLLAAFVRLIWLFDVRITEKIKIDKYYRVVLDVFFGIFSCVVLLVIYLRILFIPPYRKRRRPHILPQFRSL